MHVIYLHHCVAVVQKKVICRPLSFPTPVVHQSTRLSFRKCQQLLRHTEVQGISQSQNTPDGQTCGEDGRTSTHMNKQERNSISFIS